MKALLYLLLLTIPVQLSAQFYGCTDPLATNYELNATVNNGSCIYTTSNAFPEWSSLLPIELQETSGLLIWNSQLISHNDDSDTALYLLEIDNPSNFNTFPLSHVTNSDWEDLAEDEDYFYIGDFGNNVSGNRTDLRIYRIPKITWMNQPEVDTISFSYETQTDFTPQAANSTNFDCEAFIVTEQFIYLFTKEWISGNTTLYQLEKTPGTHQATFVSNFNSQGLITGATHLEDKKLVVLTGYNGFLQPFIYLLYDFQNADFFSGNKRRIGLNLSYHQMEAITTTDGLIYYLSNERFQSGSVTTPAKLYKYDLSAYTNLYLQSESLSAQQVGASDEIHLFPNPVSTKLTLRLKTSDFEKISTVEIGDLNGRIIHSQAIEESNSELTIDVTPLKKGAYFLIGKNNRNERIFETTFHIE